MPYAGSRPVSVEAVKWAMDDAPMLRTEKGKPDTTARHVLQVLAEHAHADGSNAYPSVLRIGYRTGYNETTIRRALRRLETGGLIFAEGEIKGCTCWRLALGRIRPALDWDALVETERASRDQAAERKRRSRATVTDSASGRHALRVRDVTDTASGRHGHSAPRTIREPSREPPQNRQPLAQQRASERYGSVRTDAPLELDGFEAFWSAYPRRFRGAGSVARRITQRAWTNALLRGGNAAAITDAATRHATQWSAVNAAPRDILHPATWLNDERYEDDESEPAPTVAR
ncbi:helix-turn-helix domain-containing protein [Streptomyces sp. BH104]|uniref:helix-turn-helix domain-containing protein n=1 Tax=Streptomyces sp. BH104 TaxID=3410407 RepID=UPI003BB6E3DB